MIRRIGPALLFERLWEETGCRAVIAELVLDESGAARAAGDEEARQGDRLRGQDGDAGGAAPEPAAAEMVLVLHVADDGLDGGAASQRALDFAEYAAPLARDEEAAWMGSAMVAVTNIADALWNAALDPVVSLSYRGL